MKPTFENPSAPPSPEDPHRERFERFLAQDQRHTRMALGMAFKFIDRLEEKAQAAEMPEVPTPQSADERVLAFISRYSSNVIKSLFEQEAAMQGFDEQKSGMVAAYEEFLAVLAEPELRPRLLASLWDERASWPERKAFRRLTYEVYGREKVFQRDENGREKGILSLEGQADLVEAWNLKGNWGISPEEFQAVRAQIPDLRERLLEHDDEPSVVPVLTPYLAAEIGESGSTVRQDGVERTFRELWKIAATGVRAGVAEGPRTVELGPGQTHVPGLRFEVLDLEGSSAPEDFGEGEALPHAAVMALAAENPEWLEAIYLKGMPSVMAGGYRATQLGGDWETIVRGTPEIDVMDSNRGPRLDLMISDEEDDIARTLIQAAGVKVPRFVE